MSARSLTPHYKHDFALADNGGKVLFILGVSLCDKSGFLVYARARAYILGRVVLNTEVVVLTYTVL